MENLQLNISEEAIVSKIYLIRNLKVMLDSDLALLYQVETKRLNEQVKRNVKRFPEDFMFQLTSEEWENLKSQFATSSWGGRRILPYVFTEHGVLMLSSVLNSERAIAVNIKVVRVYNKLREMLFTNQELLHRIEEIERKAAGHDERILGIFDYLKKLTREDEEQAEAKQERTEIGFRRDN